MQLQAGCAHFSVSAISHLPELRRFYFVGPGEETRTIFSSTASIIRRRVDKLTSYAHGDRVRASSGSPIARMALVIDLRCDARVELSSATLHRLASNMH